jgi:hypothetical protein
MIDLGTWLLFTAMAYPLIGLAFYSLCLAKTSGTKLREIDARHPGVPVWMMIVVAMLVWPRCFAIAYRKGSTRAVLDRQGRDGRSQ